MVIDDVSLLVTVPAAVVPSFNVSVAVWPLVAVFLAQPASVASANKRTTTDLFIPVPSCNERTKAAALRGLGEMS
jgi:hypothetical protein